MNAFTGTSTLIRLILRRDRFALPIWIGIVALLAAGVASSFVTLYKTAEEIQTVVAESAGSPATAALLGPVYAPNVGALVAWRWTMQGVIVLGLFSLFTVIRHTRTDEQAGRHELIGSAVVGRHASLTAALIVTLGADLVLAALVAGLLTGLGLPAAGAPARSSLRWQRWPRN
jgi:ABC-2 type transport system permease protein